MARSNTATSPTRTSSSNTSSKARRITGYVLLGLLSLLFAFVGGQKVVGAEQMMTNMAEMHYGGGATRLIGVLELMAVAALWWRRTRTLTLLGLLLIMAGAAGTHLGAGHPPAQVAPVFVIATVIGCALVVDRGRALWDFLLHREAA